jgi:hypothetical protein
MRSLREPPGRPRRPGDGEAKDPLACVGREVAPLSRPLPTLTTDPTHTHITHAGMHTCYQDMCRSHTHTHTHKHTASHTPVEGTLERGRAVSSQSSASASSSSLAYGERLRLRYTNDSLLKKK